MKKNTSPAFLFTSGIAVILLVTLIIFYWVMRPPMGDLEHMAQFLSITAVISILAGFGSYRLGWLERAPSLRWALIGSYILASLLTFINVWLAARLMFNSQHDLLLATILLVFAGGIAVSLGGFFTSALIDRIKRLEQATRAIESGKLSARANIPGSDEIASLAGSFNQMAEQLEKAAKKQTELDALRHDLVAWAGHDLRTPLSSIRVLIEALSDGVVTEPQVVQQYLQQTKRQVDHLSHLVDDLFQVSQLDSGNLPLHLEPASLSDLISDTLESFSSLAAQKEVILSGTAASEIDPVLMDAQWMGRVINNLISNALRYTPPGGNVTIQAIRVGDEVRVSVSDTGEGILPEDIPLVFDRFYRGDKSRNQSSGGAGLGLAIVKGVVEAHGGSIQVESVRGKGSVFTFCLPIH